MGVLHTPSRHTFECDGTQRVFPIPSLIISQDFVRIEIDGVLQSDRKQWDIVNNSLVFVVAPISGAILDVQVASDSESLGELGMIANVDILAKNITNVNKVANNIVDVTKVANINTDVTKVAGIVSNIPIVSAISTNVTKVANINTDVTKVAGIVSNIPIVSAISTNVTTVANNILDIQNAEENSIIAKEEAWRAEAERLTAKSYATEPEDVYVKIYTSNNDGTFTVTNTADYSSYHWERKATTLVTKGIIDDVTSSADRTYSSNKIDGIVSDLENDVSSLDNTTVKLTENQTIAGVKTFSSTITGNITGNAGTATKLQTARTINGVAFDGSTNITVSDSTTVKLTGNQTIAGVKTFSSSPIVPTPTVDTQAANKAYVDSASGGAWSANDSRAKTALNASGTAPIYACRAWVNFNGTGTLAIRGSGNVSSIIDNGVGDYTIVPISGFTDNNISGVVTGGGGGGGNINIAWGTFQNIPTGPSSSLRFQLLNMGSSGSTYTLVDCAYTCAAIFR